MTRGLVLGVGAAMLAVGAAGGYLVGQGANRSDEPAQEDEAPSQEPVARDWSRPIEKLGSRRYDFGPDARVTPPGL